MRFLTLALVLAACQPTQAAAPASAVASAPATAAPAIAPMPDGTATVAYASSVSFGSRSIPVEVADTSASREQGLSGRASLAADTGMVLSWPMPTQVGIWMPDMNFPLDVIFVRDNKVNALYENVPPCTQDGPCPTFGPREGVNFVLEAPAGSAKRWNLKVGDAMTLKAGRAAEPDTSM